MAMHQGMEIPEYADPADVPAAFVKLVESGPVPRFPNAASRNTAIPAPHAGALSWVNNIFEYWNGSKWTNLVPVANLPTATTSRAGVVMLENAITASKTKAITPFAVQIMEKLINSLKADLNKAYKAGGTGLAVRWGTGGPPAGSFTDGALYFQY